MESLSGTIIKGVGGAYTVTANGATYTCTARGIFRNRNTTPLVGDRVEITVTDSAKKIATLHTIHPRTNQLRRPPAANIGQVIITISTTRPPFNPGLLDRFLLLVEHENIPVLICVNKIDLGSEDSKTAGALPLLPHPLLKKGGKTLTFEDYADAGYPIVYTAALEGTGLDALRREMAGKINLFAGPSGVGKSSIINALLPGANLETGDLSGKIGRGKHTTRHTEIFPLGDMPGDGFCFDTPGFTSLDTAHIEKSELAALFREFAPFTNSCQFNNCLHNREKTCAVKEQVGKKIHPARYESYIKLLEGD